MTRTVTLYGGETTNIDRPDLSKFSAWALASQLGNLAVFNGATKRFYSLAEHSVHLATLVENWGGDKADQRVALLSYSAAVLIGPHVPWLGDLLGYRQTLAWDAAAGAIAVRFELGEYNADLVEQAGVALDAFVRHAIMDGPEPAPADRIENDHRPQLQCLTPHSAGELFKRAARLLGVQ